MSKFSIRTVFSEVDEKNYTSQYNFTSTMFLDSNYRRKKRKGKKKKTKAQHWI